MQVLSDFIVRFLRQSIGAIARAESRCPSRKVRRHTTIVEQLESRVLLTVQFSGGNLLPHVEVQGVYLGADWTTSTNATTAANLEQFLGTIANSPYMDMMTNAGYNVFRGTSTAGFTDTLNINKSIGITDTQIHNELQAKISLSQVAAPDPNRLYVVFVEPGVVIKTSFGASNNAFLGYHGAFAGVDASNNPVDIRYAVISYPGSPNFSSTSQGFSASHGFSADFNEITAVASHELSEAVTDPDVNYKSLGWYDFNLNGEVADLANDQTALLNNLYTVSLIVGKNDNILTIPNPSTSQLSAPQHVSVTPTSTSSVIVKWDPVVNATGYRVFEVVGTTNLQIGSNLSAGTTTLTVSSANGAVGLTAGKTITFYVEAFNATKTSDSAPVSALLPPPPAPALTAPQVTATALSPTSVQLAWGLVTGAQGYNLYYWDAGQAVFLGKVSATTNVAKIANLKAGTAYRFIVEAINGALFADSTWTNITTPTSTPTHH